MTTILMVVNGAPETSVAKILPNIFLLIYQNKEIYIRNTDLGQFEVEWFMTLFPFWLNHPFNLGKKIL